MMRTATASHRSTPDAPTMPRALWRRAPASLVLWVPALVLALSALQACSLVPPATPIQTYDFGPPAAVAPGAAALPRLRVTQTDGPAWLDNNAIYYRLHYAQAERLQPYATQRWVMSPLRLFDERLHDAVAARGVLGWQGDTASPALKVDMLDFEQVFDSATASHGVVRVRASVYRNGMIGQKTFVAEPPAATPDGSGGVRALASGTDAVVAAILDWVATLPLR